MHRKILSLRLIVFIAATFFLGQTFAQQHVHIDDTASSSCLVCAQADSDPLLPSQINASKPADIFFQAVGYLYRSEYVAAQANFTIRGPPQLT